MSSAATPRKLTLYTNHLTPNGLQVSIYLEELKLVTPRAFEYIIERVDLQKGTHKEEKFLAMNPNGRIPVLVDHTLDNFAIFESAAILLYLEQYLDRQKEFSFRLPQDHSSMVQWILFGHGNLAPMQAQTHFFFHFAPENVPYGKKKYHEETRRLYGILDKVLTNRDWLVGAKLGQYSVADMNLIPWVRLHRRAGLDTLDAWPNLKAWLARSLERPGVQAAIDSVAF